MFIKDDYFHIYCEDCGKLVIEYVEESGGLFYGSHRGKRTEYFNTTNYWNQIRCEDCSEKLKRFINTYYYKDYPQWED